MEKLELAIELLLPGVPDERDECTAPLQQRLATVQRLAMQAGAQVSKRYQHELMPEEKVTAIRELAAGETVAMVGDGVNDAPAPMWRWKRLTSR